MVAQEPLQQLCINQDQDCLALPSIPGIARLITTMSTQLYCLMMLMESFAMLSLISVKLQPNLALLIVEKGSEFY